MISNIKAILAFKTRLEFGDDTFMEVVAWYVPLPVRGSAHLFKYRLAYIESGVCVVRYDNEAGKGDHKHVGDFELPYVFSDLPQLLRDFEAEVDAWRRRA